MWTVIAKTKYIAVSPTQIEMYPVLVYQCASVTCRYEIPGETGAFIAEIECSDLVKNAMAQDKEMLFVSASEHTELGAT